MDATQVLDVLLNGGSGAVVLFLFYYLITKHIPALAADFKDTLLKMTASFERQMEEERKFFTTQVQSEREVFATQLDRLLVGERRTGDGRREEDHGHV